MVSRTLNEPNEWVLFGLRRCSCDRSKDRARLETRCARGGGPNVGGFATECAKCQECPSGDQHYGTFPSAKTQNVGSQRSCANFDCWL